MNVAVFCLWRCLYIWSVKNGCAVAILLLLLFASIGCFQNGVDVKTVSNNLGHATVAFTMDKYVHVSMTMQQDCVSKMESFIASL